ncbi:MAG: exopolysaccharide biosynthesis polyprenyl glycosylphosphotransferase [Microthrixaceae bacterium]
MSHFLDFLAVYLPLAAAAMIISPNFPGKIVLLMALVATLLLWPTSRRGRLALGPSEGLASIIARLGLAPVVTTMIVSIVQFNRFNAPPTQINPVAVLAIVLCTVPAVMLGRLISFRLTGLARSRGFDVEDTLIVGIGPIGIDVAKALQDNPEFGLVPVGFVDRFIDEVPLPLVGRPEDLPAILEATGIKHVILAFGAADEQELVGIIRRCQERLVQFYAVPRLFELGVSAEQVGHEVSGLPVVPLRRPGRSAGLWPAKRAFDLITAAVLTTLALPVLIGCAIAVKLTSPGPIFFRQVRIGVGGRPFEILKFRTMRVNDDSATQWSVQDDDRVTAVGRILRPTHLDELPQLLNVLKGEMSLVGPRPERPHFVEQFSSEIDGYEFRHRVPVGITGWAQVNGYWGDTSIETRVRLDNRYIENWSLWRDLVIGLRTIPTLLGKRR